ncbi:hypothetical protein [Candidatus Leptofilum sp.]|uniref:hypothetical protein n=1 Tax=Candidatus Leptofilum sp. TaxID=3241576 RepID=UPI003B58C81E
MNKQHKIGIVAGAWRPHDALEHIAWIKPPWGSNDYIWLDFPEAIFSDQGLLYLSHVSSLFPTKFPNLPPVAWQDVDTGIQYERTLPNAVSWRGFVGATTSNLVELSLTLTNGSPEPLTTIRLQTCLFMRAHYQLSAYGLSNKFIHTEQGWVDLEAVGSMGEENGRYHFGWRSGPKIADLPVIACQTSSARHIVAFSWRQDTYSLICNPDHPCIHADPAIPDLAPGASYTLQGEIYFANNGLAEIEDRYAQ